jgi:maleylpyruvate isomerase
MGLKLYSYFRSSSSWRVRIALNHKRLDYAYAPIHLLQDGGQQHRPEFKSVNPLGMVPVLEIEAEGAVHRIAQSIAILEFLEEAHPEPPLLPRDRYLRARARQLSEIVNSSIQPLHNLMVLRKVTEELGGERNPWAQDFIGRGLHAFEVLARDSAGPYAVCGHPTFADVCLVPQLYQARRFGTDLTPYPTCLAIEAACSKLEAFAAAAPDKQPDAEH